jgi:hypothetical protein
MLWLPLLVLLFLICVPSVVPDGAYPGQVFVLSSVERGLGPPHRGGGRPLDPGGRGSSSHQGGGEDGLGLVREGTQGWRGCRANHEGVQ